MTNFVPGPDLPVLTVDEIHWQKINAGHEEALEYSLAARDGFQLSTREFNFPIPEGADFQEPNIIQIVIGKDALYATAYDKGNAVYVLDKANLVPMYGSKAFEGFPPGSKCIIAIGHLAPPTAELPQPKFSVMWAGVLNII